MKKNLLFTIATIACISVTAQFNAEKEPLITKSLTTDIIRSIKAETSGGHISISGVNSSEARIEVYVVPNIYRENKVTEADIRRRMADDYDVSVMVEGNKLTAKAKAKDRNMNWQNALNFSYKIYIPRDVSTDLSTSGGSIHLKNLNGIQDFSTSGGSLNIEELSGKIKGRTSGGSINIENSNDEIDLSTSGGSINASNCKGKLLLHTSGGSLHLEDLDGTIKANTSGGSINGKNIAGELSGHTSGGSIHLADLSCSLETSTSGGNITVSITKLGNYVKITNSAGHVNLTIPKNKGVDLDLSGKVVNSQLDHFEGKINDDLVKGKLNGGGIPITINTDGGKIVLSVK